jgi:FMN phosphatase YigB (HAD superfamily)
VFVDDLAANIRGAVAVGMIGVHHTVAADTIGELGVLFERSLH